MTDAHDNDVPNDDVPDDDVQADDAELDALLALVGRAFAEGDPVPETLGGSGVSYVQWYAPGADIGVLFEAELAGVRDAGEHGDLEFVSERMRVSLHATPARIVGELTPWGGDSAVWLEHRGGRVEVPVDEGGELYLVGPPLGPIRLRVEAADGVMITDWFVIARP